MAVILEDKQGLLSGLKYSKTLSDCDNKGEDDCDDNDGEQHGANSEEAEFNDEESDDDVENKNEVEH